MGISAGIRYELDFVRKCKIKFSEYYILKCDVSKFFASINHDALKEKLKIEYYVRYQDDFLLFHNSKEYLKYWFKEIKKFLEKEKIKFLL